MTFSVSRDGQLYLLKAIFRPRCMVLVWITIKDRVSVKSLRVRVRLRVSVSRLDVVWGWKIVPVMYICQSWMESNTKRLVLGFQVFYSVLLQTNLRSSAPLSKRSSTTVSVCGYYWKTGRATEADGTGETDWIAVPSVPSDPSVPSCFRETGYCCCCHY